MTIGRGGGHPAHHDRRRKLNFLAGVDPVMLANQKAPERLFGTQQRFGEEAAFEIAPCIEHVLRLHRIKALCTGFRRTAEAAACRVHRAQAVATVKDGPFRVYCMDTWLAAALFISFGTMKG